MNPTKDDLHLKVSWARLYENPATNVGPQPLFRLQHFRHRRTELLVNTKAVIIIFVNVCNEREKENLYIYIKHLWMYKYDYSENVCGLIHVLFLQHGTTEPVQTDPRLAPCHCPSSRVMV